MKRYLQPCNMSGSLYGKKERKGSSLKRTLSKKGPKSSLVSSYDELYKTQYVKMKQLFKK